MLYFTLRLLDKCLPAETLDMYDLLYDNCVGANRLGNILCGMFAGTRLSSRFINHIRFGCDDWKKKMKTITGH